MEESDLEETTGASGISVNTDGLGELGGPVREQPDGPHPGAHQIPWGACLGGGPLKTTSFKALGEESGFGFLNSSAGECSVTPGRRIILPDNGMQSSHPANGPEREEGQGSRYTPTPRPNSPQPSPQPPAQSPSQPQGAV